MQATFFICGRARAFVRSSLRGAGIALIALLSACASVEGPPEISAIKPSIAVLPFDSVLSTNDSTARELAAFESQFYPAAISRRLADEAWPSFYSPLKPPAGANYVLKGQVVESGPDGVVLNLQFCDASGTEIDSKRISVTRGELKGQRMSTVVLARASNAVNHFAGKLTADSIQQTERTNIRALVGDPSLPVSPTKLKTYENVAALLQTRMLQAPQAQAVKFANEQSSAYDNLRSAMGRMADAKSAASRRQTMSFITGLAVFAGGMAAASRGQMDNSSANQVATAATTSFMNGYAESEKAEALEKEMKSSLNAFKSFGSERRSEFAMMGDSVQAGTLQEQYAEVDRLVKGLVLGSQ